MSTTRRCAILLLWASGPGTLEQPIDSRRMLTMRHPLMHRIALDTSFLYTDIGFGTYTDALVRGLLPLGDEDEWHFVSNELPETIPAFATIRENKTRQQFDFPENVRIHWTRYSRRIIWANTGLPRYLRRSKIDLFHSVDNFTLPFVHKPCKYILTLHDLIPLRFPHLVEKKNAIILRLFMSYVLRRADRILCVSNSTRDDLVSMFPNLEQKAVVIHSGIDTTRFRPLDSFDEREDVSSYLRERYGVHGGYILSVATLNPRRNLGRLIEAFRELQSDPNHKDRQLVIAGVSDYRSEELSDLVVRLGLVESVRFLGYVPREDLPKLYQCAACSVCVSLYEGFGFPVLESLACGVPTVASRVSSLPEIGGEVTVYVDPLDTQDIARGINAALADSDSVLSQDRIAWASQFRWEATARKTYDLYRETLGG